MQKTEVIENLKALYREYTGSSPEQIEEIPRAVSSRKYFRLSGAGKNLVGTYSPDIRESRAFLTFSQVFLKIGVHVPEVFISNNDKTCYLQEDLGDMRLHELVASRDTPQLNTQLLDLYKSSIQELIKLQVKSDKLMDYSICVPRSEFDLQSVMWDLNHFKYYFLKPSGIAFDEQRLEDAFRNLAKSINSIEHKGFMFRDFQSRNIMIKKNETYLIDFQGGRRGPILYDIASMVYEAKASLTDDDRDALIRFYMDSMQEYNLETNEKTMREFYLVALVRVLQALGAYGLRGNIEKKAVFMQSIPAGLENMESIVGQIQSVIHPYLGTVLTDLAETRSDYQPLPKQFSGLTITIYSFSYRKPLPDDIHGNGGGFVFDCRFLENPGRYTELKDFTGLQKPVIDFLEERSEVNHFISTIKSQLEMVVHSYQKQNYDQLMISFGCTGGRHRSVYTAHKIANWLKEAEGVRVIEIHRELPPGSSVKD